MKAVDRSRVRNCRRRWVTLSALVLTAHAGSARADDNPVSAIVFGSMDAAPPGFAAAGAKIGFDRVDREGFAVLASVGAGRRSEAVPSILRWTMLGSALVGHQWFYDWGVVALFAGPEASMEALSGPGGTVVLPGRFGFRLHGEVWARPTDDTLVTATLILGSAQGHTWTRLSYGVRLWGAYLGPEAALYAEEAGYRKWSLGLHATDVALGGFSFRVSAGYLIESTRSEGSPYVAITLWRPM